MFPMMNPKMMNMDKMKKIKDMGDMEFELKFNESRYLERPFMCRVFYNQLSNMPSKMEFVRFEKDKDFQKAKLCLHNCVDNKQVRYFIKYVPKEVKPFTVKITLCPDCGFPLAYRFIVYPGDLKNYPKMKDIDQYRTKGKIVTGQEKKPPKAIETPEYRIGV